MDYDKWKQETPTSFKLSDEGFEILERCKQCNEKYSMDDLKELTFSTPQRKHNDLCCDYCTEFLTNSLSLPN